MPVVDIMGDATDATLALAAASGEDLASAAGIVSKQLGVWGETGVTATQVADALASAANASTVDVGELALGLSNVGGSAKTAGVDFGELVQTMALIAPNFSSAADAGTSLKTMISRLQPTTDPAGVAMQRLGLFTEETGSAFYDAQGNFVGMEETSRLLYEATKDLSEEEKSLAFNTIFGSDAIRAAAAIANAGGEGYAAMGQAMADAGGATAAAAIKQQGFNFALDQAKGSLETAQIIIGSMLLPVLSELLNTYITPGINALGVFAQAVGGSDEAFAALSPQLQQAVVVVGQLLDQAGGVAAFLVANWQPAVAIAGGALAGLLVPAIAAAGAAFSALFAPAAAIAGGAATAAGASILPIIGILAAAGAAGAALYGAWQQNFGGIQEATAGAMTAVQGVVTSVLGVVAAFWADHGAAILGFATEAWTQIQQIVGTTVAAAAAVISTVLGAVGAFIGAHGEEIQTVLTFVWETIATVIGSALDVIQGVVTTVLGVVTGDWETASAGIGQIVEGLVSLVEGQFTNLQTLVEGLGPAFLSAATTLGQAIVDGIVGGISAGASAIADAAGNAAQAALDAAKDLLGISSPSTAFFAVGDDSAEGQILGMKARASDVEAAGAALGQAAWQSAMLAGDAPLMRTATAVSMAPTSGASPAHPGAGAASGGDTYYLDLRGAAPGVGGEVERAIRRVQAQTGRSAQIRAQS